MADATVADTGKAKPPISGVLEDIKKAEAKTRGTLKDAEAHKEKAIADAKREAIAIRERAVKDTEAAIERVVNEANSIIETDRKRVLESAELRAGKVRSQANSRVGQAKDLLLKDVMRTIDDQA